MLIEIYSDPICPWCFIGKRRLERAYAKRPSVAVEFRWRAFQLNPWMPRDGMARGEYLTAKFGAVDAGRVFDGIRRVGQSEGIRFDFDLTTRIPNTIDAHRLIRWAGRRRPAGGEGEMAEALFQAYFIGGEDIGDPAALAQIAAAVGHDGAAAARYLGSGEDTEAVRLEDSFARQMGIQGVPCFIVDGRFSISGAQEPEYLMPLFDLAASAGPHAAE